VYDLVWEFKILPFVPDSVKSKGKPLTSDVCQSANGAPFYTLWEDAGTFTRCFPSGLGQLKPYFVRTGPLASEHRSTPRLLETTKNPWLLRDGPLLVSYDTQGSPSISRGVLG